MRILLAEDDPLFRFALTAQLLDLGHDVTAVSDGQEALEALASGANPEVLILDWHMPRVSGIEVCQKLHPLPTSNRPRLLILSGRGDKESLDFALANGAELCLVKPFAEEELVAALKNLPNRSQEGHHRRD